MGDLAGPCEDFRVKISIPRFIQLTKTIITTIDIRLHSQLLTSTFNLPHRNEDATITATRHKHHHRHNSLP